MAPSASREETSGGGKQTRARLLRKNATDAERVLWSELRKLKALGLHFRRQAPFAKYVADFACHRSKIIVELDGSQHGLPENIEHDTARTAYLNSRGYRVLRFPNDVVFRNLPNVIEEIVRTVRSPHPTRNR